MNKQEIKGLHYRIFDVNKPILEDYKEYEAAKASEAVKMYLKDIGETDKQIRVSGSDFVRISAQPFVFKDGTRYRTNKKTMWFVVN